LAPSLASLSFLPLAVHLCPFVSNKVRSTPSIFPFFFFAHLQSMDRENDGLGWDGGGLLAPNGLSLPHVVFTLFIFLIRVHPPPSSLLHYRFSFSLSLSLTLTRTRTRTRTISLSLFRFSRSTPFRLCSLTLSSFRSLESLVDHPLPDSYLQLLSWTAVAEPLLWTHHLQRPTTTASLLFLNVVLLTPCVCPCLPEQNPSTLYGEDSSFPALFHTISLRHLPSSSQIQIE